jgi:hypothetical protein
MFVEIEYAADEVLYFSRRQFILEKIESIKSMKEKSRPNPAHQGGSAVDCERCREMDGRSSLRRCRLKPPGAASRQGREFPALNGEGIGTRFLYPAMSESGLLHPG